MRLLDTLTGQFVERDPEKADEDGKKVIYAILSHTWDKAGEQTYMELKEIQKRHPPEPKSPQSPPSGLENLTSSSSPEQVRSEPSIPLPPSQLPSDPPSVSATPGNVASSFPEPVRDEPLPPPLPIDPPATTTPLVTPSGPSKSWFSRRMGQLKRRLCRHRSAHNAHHIQSDGDEASITPTPSVHPLSPDDPPVPVNDPYDTASNPSAPSPGDNSPPQTTRLPAPLGRLTQSEVEGLFRMFAESYGLPNPNNPLAPAASSDAPAPSTENQPPSPPRSIWDDPDLSPKIQDTCKIARENGYRYIWIDSCCIDKSSSSELSEAINSMYKWYLLADVCYAFLADVPPGEDHRAERSCFRKSRWFTRGWTLQELIAPANVVFLAKDWTPIGSKYTLIDLVESTTDIHYDALLKTSKPLDAFSVAQRLSWAANRETTREEDRAYSLLGIFGIHMPTLYGEGGLAFRRLQEHIMQRIPDQSLFAWGTVDLSGSHFPEPEATTMLGAWVISFLKGRLTLRNRPLFVQSPHGFMNGANVRHVQLPPSLRYDIEYTLTPLGIRTRFWMIPSTHDLVSSLFPPYSKGKHDLSDESDRWYLAILGCEHIQHPGHLLGRVCYTRPSEFNIDFLHTNYDLFTQTNGEPEKVTDRLPDLFPLSIETIERCRPYIELKTVYIPHPQSNHTNRSPLWDLQHEPSVARITLVLLMATCNTLRFRGYSADLRHPAPEHPTTHWLTLSKAKHTITVKFRHTLKYNIRVFAMKADVRLSGSLLQPDSTPDRSDRTDSDGHKVSWMLDHYPRADLGPQLQSIRLSAAGAGVLTVDLSLRFLRTGIYSVEIDIRSDATKHAALREMRDGSPSGVRVVNAEDAGGCETASAEARYWPDSASDGAAADSEEVDDGST